MGSAIAGAVVGLPSLAESDPVMGILRRGDMQFYTLFMEIDVTSIGDADRQYMVTPRWVSIGEVEKITFKDGWLNRDE